MGTESGPAGRLLKGKEIHIIGAGISGLLMAYYLKKAGHKVTIFEKERVGGKIQTKQTEGGPAEKAANAIYSSPETMELISELGLSPLYPAQNLKKKIWRFEKPLRFPLRFREVLRLIVGLFKKPPSRDDMSVLDFFSPLMGKRAANEVLSAVFGGIYGTSADKLDFQSVFKESPHKKNYLQFFKAVSKNKKRSPHRATSISFKNGMSDFIKALQEKLEAHIVRQEVFEIRSGVNTILCCEAHEAAKILENDRQKIALALKEIDYVPLSTGTYFFKRPIPELNNSFGILISPGSSIKAIGVLHNSDIFTGRTKVDQLESYTFISRSEDYAQTDALRDASYIAKKNFNQSDILVQEQTCWSKGIPLYDIKRRNAISKVRAHLKNEAGLVVFGNYVDGISIREMIKSAKNFAACY